MYLVAVLLAGLALGAWAAMAWQRQRTPEMLRLLAKTHSEERGSLQQRINELQQQLQSHQDKVVELSTGLATEKQRTKNLEAHAAEQKTAFEHLNERMTKEFKLIASSLMEEKGRQLTALQEDKLNVLLMPFRSQIKDFQQQVQEAYDKEGKERFALKSEVARLVEQNQKLTEGAESLARALKGDSQVQGAWGEVILARLLEDSGLVKGQQYTMQASTTQADGTRLRPDAVITLPDQKHLVIDSKVSLVHYDKFCSAADEDGRSRFLRQHVDSMRAHAKGLGEKNYAQLYGISSVDFVLMFVPIEPAFLLALRERPEIFQEAYDRQVVMVTHSTLMATLRTIHGLWKNEQVARNHMEIAQRAGLLYDKFVGFTDDLSKIGKHVDEARDHYHKALGKLSEGPGNLVRQVEKLKELGARANKAIPPPLVERAGT